jgi:ElaB/YqjD/DUF883 family membrane-anchored ribosome-binding protein
MKTNTLTESLNERLEAARENLARAQERVSEIYDETRDKVVAHAKTTDKTIRKHPYESMAIAFGVGALVGWLVSRRKSGSYDEI